MVSSTAKFLVAASRVRAVANKHTFLQIVLAKRSLGENSVSHFSLPAGKPHQKIKTMCRPTELGVNFF